MSQQTKPGITASAVLPTLPYTYEQVIETNYGKVFTLPDLKMMICELTQEYVPIEHFRKIFEATTPLIAKYGITKFIFDKQNLRVFHQPSMEWYFVHWKKEVYGLGVSVHRKILPQDQPAFEQAVKAGRAKIVAEYIDTVIPYLDIQYKKTIIEAIES